MYYLAAKGDYKFKSAFGMSSNERMHLRVNLRLIDDVWYLIKLALHIPWEVVRFLLDPWD